MLWAVNLAYTMVLGKPVIFWGGVSTFVFFIATFLVPIINKFRIQKIPMTVHKILASITFAMVLGHGLLGLFVYM